MDSSGTLSPSSHRCGNRGSLAGAKTLLRFRPAALLFCLHPPPVNRDPPPSRYKERSENRGVCGQLPCFMRYLYLLALPQLQNRVTVT